MKLVVALVTIFAASAMAACSQGQGPTSSGSPSKLESTSSLVARPEIRQIVDELAAAGVFSSERVGYGGAPSMSFAIFTRLRAAATDAEMIALLQHASPVVRSYAAQHVIERDLGIDAVDPLLADGALVETLFGCIGGSMTVARVTVQSLCSSSKSPAAAAKLATLSKGGDDLSQLASQCLAWR